MPETAKECIFLRLVIAIKADQLFYLFPTFLTQSINLNIIPIIINNMLKTYQFVTSEKVSL